MLAAAKGRWFAGKYTASYLGFFLTFGLMGLWHGIEPHYLLYGLYHGTLLVGHDLFTRWNKRRQVWGHGPLWRATGTLVTFHLVCLGFLLFSGKIGPTWTTTGGILPMTISDRVLDVLVGVSEIEDIRHDPDVRLYDLQILDSMQTVKLIVAFSSEFGVDISPAELDREEWATPRKIISYMERKIGA